MSIKILYCLVVLLFGTNLSYANEFPVNNDDKADETSKAEEKSSIAPQNDILNLDNKQILIDEDLSIDKQEPEDFVQLLPNKDSDLEKDKNTSLQEKEDTEVFSLESKKNNQEELGNNIELNKDLLPKQDLSVIDKPDEDNKENKTPVDNSHDSDNDEFDKENTEALKFPQWEDLFKDEIAVWKYKKTPNMTIYGKLGENNNNHLPRIVYLQDYNQQIYYCIIKNDLSGLRAIINKLEGIGMTADDILTLKPDLVHDLLTFAMKTGKRNIVDFLLYKGAVFSADSSDELLSAAIQYGYFDLADSIINVRNSSFKKINNDLNSNMYKWAMKVKHNKN